MMLKLLWIIGLFGWASAFAIEEKFMSTEVAFEKSRITRRLNVKAVSPGASTIQDALAIASPGDELVLGDGTYQLSSTISITKDVTIRAANSRQAILDGGNSNRVIHIGSNTVVLLEGLVITNGKASLVSPHAL